MHYLNSKQYEALTFGTDLMHIFYYEDCSPNNVISHVDSNHERTQICMVRYLVSIYVSEYVMYGLAVMNYVLQMLSWLISKCNYMFFLEANARVINIMTL